MNLTNKTTFVKMAEKNDALIPSIALSKQTRKNPTIDEVRSYILG